MKIAVTSDLHGLLPDSKPEAELLLLCGDISPLNIQSDMVKMEKWIRNHFIPWAGKWNQVIMVAGNHDLFFERTLDIKLKELLKGTNIIYLENSGIVWNDISIFGTPWCSTFGNWSFMASDEYLESKYSDIPKKVDILISHDSPSYEGLGMIHSGFNVGRDAGNKVLTNYLKLKKPRYFFGGHIHSGNHEFHLSEDGIMVGNVSYVGESYQPEYEILVFDYQEK